MIYFWLGAIVLFALIEAATLSLTSVWFAFGALLALIAAAMNLPQWAQFAFFIAGSILFLALTRPFVTKYLKVGRAKTNVDAVIGQKAIVVETIDNIGGTGQIKVGGLVWSARSEDESVIAPESMVEIVRVAGVRAFVKKI